MTLRRYRELVADFETVNDPRDCRVWAWATATISPNPITSYGLAIEEFFDAIKQRDSIIWFHNLKFDGMFILDYLLRNGYTHTVSRETPLTFSTIISQMGEFYQFCVVHANGVRTYFKDSLKKLPFKVSVIAKTFKLPEGKGEIDYNKPRPVGYTPTHEEWDYIRRDVEIVARAMHEQLKRGTKLTLSADALADFKQSFGKNLFSKYFPKISQDEDTIIRKAYRGGFTYASPRFIGRDVGPGRVFDVNSLYPSRMMHEELPYGNPIPFIGKPANNGKLFIVSITLTAKIKEEHIPCIQIKNTLFYSPTQYQTELKEPTTILVTNVDLALIRDQYHTDILAWNGGYYFNHTRGMFDEYINRWGTEKEQSDGGARQIAKGFMNSLYGKFATNPDVTQKIPTLDKDKNIVRLVKGEEEVRDPVYTPMGVFITSYARNFTIRAAQKNYERFAYADTDSLHLLGLEEPEGIDIDDKRLGAWKEEYQFTNGVYLRAKQYCEIVNGSPVTHIAGMPETVARDLSLADMLHGGEFHGKLIPRTVPGGVVLVDSTFTLKGTHNGK